MLKIGIYLGFGACNLVLILNTHQRIDFFGKSAPYYDIILDLLTFGQYAKFLKRGVEILAPQKGERILDLCSGTGRVASWMVQAVGDEGEVVGMDISKSMVEESKRRYGGLKKMIFLNKDATNHGNIKIILMEFSLPLPSMSFLRKNVWELSNIPIWH